MAAREPSIPIEILLQAVRHRLQHQSLRAVAREIGITHRGLGKILDGSHPRLSTLRKLEIWYDDYCETELGSARMVESLRILFEGIPPEERGEAAERLRHMLREMTGEAE